MNLSTFIILIVLIGIVTLSIRSMIKDKKSGKSSCGGNCGACGACSHGISLCDNSKLLLVKDHKKSSINKLLFFIYRRGSYVNSYNFNYINWNLCICNNKFKKTL